MSRCGVACLSALLIGLIASVANAFPALNTVFLNEHVDKLDDKEFAEYVKTKVKCNFCHQGKNRKNRNSFGVPLSELVDARQDGRNQDKLKQALVTAFAMHSDAEDENSPTYGEMFLAGKLPGGELEKVLEEPAEE